MPDRLALVIGLESPLPAPHAETDALAFSQAMRSLAIPATNVTLLTGGQATRTAIESRLRKIAKAPPTEMLLVFLTTAGFVEGGETFFSCHDTQEDDLAETGFALQSFVDTLLALDSPRVVVFLDLRGEIAALDWLATRFRDRPGAVCFLSRAPGEQSHVSGSLKSGIWSHHVVEAFSGRSSRALEQGTILSVDSLQAYLTSELPRTLRATFREAPAQTPCAYSAPSRLLLGKVTLIDPNVVDPRFQPLKRGSLRGETTAKVKSLSGFRKFHRPPDRVNAGSRKFVADLAHEDVKQDVDAIYAGVRELLGYKRRDVEGSADRGTGFVRTPDFEYSVGVDLDEEDPTNVIWRREIAGIKNPEMVLSRPFQQLFGATFDTLVFEFGKPFDLESWVDHVEDDLPDTMKLRTASDCSSCEIQIRGKSTLLRLYRDRIEIQGGKSASSGGLVEAFLQFQDLFANRDVLQLPLRT